MLSRKSIVFFVLGLALPHAQAASNDGQFPTLDDFKKKISEVKLSADMEALCERPCPFNCDPFFAPACSNDCLEGMKTCLLIRKQETALNQLCSSQACQDGCGEDAECKEKCVQTWDKLCRMTLAMGIDKEEEEKDHISEREKRLQGILAGKVDVKALITGVQVPEEKAEQCDRPCPMNCDPKYVPECTNDCTEEARHCVIKLQAEISKNIFCLKPCAKNCDPEFLPECTNRCAEDVKECNKQIDAAVEKMTASPTPKKDTEGDNDEKPTPIFRQ